MIINVYTDGAARGNPGPGAAGALIECSNQTCRLKKYLGQTTNNRAEYQALILALEKVEQWIKDQRLEVEKIVCYSDSELLVKQLNRHYKVKDPELARLFVQVWNLVQKLPKVEFHHVPRERNKLADKLANQAIDEQRS